MSVPLQVLLVEDSAQDAALLLEELRRGDYGPMHLRVDTAEAMAAALEERTWDVILTDHAMPRFSAMEALALVKERGLDLPFIIVSGVIDEEAAVEAMRAGAHDYLRKDNLARLNPAVTRELREAVERRERKRAQEELHHYQEHLEQLVAERTADLNTRNTQLAAEIGERERAERERERLLAEVERQRAWLETTLEHTDAHLVFLDRDFNFLRVNGAYARACRKTPEEFIGRDHFELYPNEENEAIFRRVRDTGEPFSIRENPFVFPGMPDRGTTYWDWTLMPIKGEGSEVEYLVFSLMDVTEQVRQRERLLAAERSRAELLETLNREISHRVKNNLSMVAGMLQMQIASAQDPRLAEMLQDAIARLYTFASVHDQLTVTGSGEVDVTAAIRRCAEATRQVFLQGAVAVSVEGNVLQYPSSSAINLTVIANELITNALKHGAPSADGQLRVDVRVACDDGALGLSVWSSGNPVPAGLDLSQQTGLGLSLVQSLVVGQYGGTFTLEPESGGTLARVIFDDQRLREHR